MKLQTKTIGHERAGAVRSTILKLTAASCLACAWSSPGAGADNPQTQQNPPLGEPARAGQRAHAQVTPRPLSFEPNVGQGGTDSQYLAHGSGYALTLDVRGAALTLGSDVLRLRLDDVRQDIEPTAEHRLPGRINYYIGNDRSKWRENVATFGKVRYAQAYPGVDLVYYGTQGHLEYDFDVAPGASTKPIRLDFDGAQRLSLDGQGNLHVATHGREVVFDRPVAYQPEGSEHRSVVARYRVQGHRVSFALGAYDPHKALVIDPVLDYFSYLGGSGADVIGITSPQQSGTSGQAAAVDSAGDVYLAGYTSSTNLPTQAPFASMPVKTPGLWAFVTKFSPDGGTLIFSTYLGGTLGNDFGYAVALDASGNAFVVGSTGSNDFPVTAGAYQTICSPSLDNPSQTPESACSGTYGSESAFVTKFGPTGALLASTFLGCSGCGDAALSVAVDAAGRPYVVGYTYPGLNTPTGIPYTTPSVGFPTTAGAIVSAYSYSKTEPMNGALQYDAFVTVFDSTLSALVYSTMIGDARPFSAITANGSQTNTVGTAVTVDASGNFYLAGYSQDNYLPTTAGSYEPHPLSCGKDDTNTTQFDGDCGFVSKFSPVGGSGGPSLTYLTYLGHQATNSGSFTQEVTGIAADIAGDAYVVGYADQAGFPVTAGAYQSTCDGYDNATGVGDFDCNAAFIAKLNPTGTTLLASTYLGCVTCNGDDMYTVSAIALDGSGDAYVLGYGGSAMPVVNGFASNNADSGAAPYVAELNSGLTRLKFATFVNVGNAGQTSPAGLALDSSGAIYIAGNVNSPASTAATKGAFQTVYGGGSSDGFVAKFTAAAAPTATTTKLTASATSLTTGAAVTLTAVVAGSSGSAVPAGSVTFLDGSTALKSLTLNATGVAGYTTTSLAVGVHSITAAYGGSSADSASVSSALKVTVAATAPTVKISVAPTSITLGQSAELTWSSNAATACTASGAWTGSKAVSGSATVNPTSADPLTYSLSCTGPGGTTETSAALTVKSAPPTVKIAVSSASITQGQSATLTWSSTGATSCTASGAWSGNVATSGSTTETPSAAGSDTYTLACTGAGGTVTAGAALQVTAASSTGGSGSTAGGGGGGALDLWSLLGLGLLGLARRNVRVEG